jgi:hypothetical protein
MMNTRSVVANLQKSDDLSFVYYSDVNAKASL